jgi:hypothetical protein
VIALWIAVGFAGALLMVTIARCVGKRRRVARDDRDRCRLLAYAKRGHHVEGHGLGEPLPDSDTTDQRGGW